MGHTDKCSEIYNNIFYFNGLSEIEKKDILKHIESCPSCKAHFNKITHINHVSAIDHIEEQLLERYALSIQLDADSAYAGDHLSTAKKSLIEKHLDNCKECKARVFEMQSLYREMDTYWQDRDLPDLVINPRGAADKEDSVRERAQEYAAADKKIFPLAKAGRLAVAATLLLAVLVTFFSQDGQKATLEDMSVIEEIYIPGATRGPSVDNLQNGISLLNARDYRDAISVLQQYVKEQEDNTLKDYATFLLGLAQLKLAATDGNDIVLEAGIQTLNGCLDKSDNQHLYEDIHWYLGKAELLRKDYDRARYHFEKVRDMSGSRSEDSRLILELINNL